MAPSPGFSLNAVKVIVALAIAKHAPPPSVVLDLFNALDGIKATLAPDVLLAEPGLLLAGDCDLPDEPHRADAHPEPDARPEPPAAAPEEDQDLHDGHLSADARPEPPAAAPDEEQDLHDGHLPVDARPEPPAAARLEVQDLPAEPLRANARLELGEVQDPFDGHLRADALPEPPAAARIEVQEPPDGHPRADARPEPPAAARAEVQDLPDGHLCADALPEPLAAVCTEVHEPPDGYPRADVRPEPPAAARAVAQDLPDGHLRAYARPQPPAAARVDAQDLPDEHSRADARPGPHAAVPDEVRDKKDSKTAKKPRLAAKAAPVAPAARPPAASDSASPDVAVDTQEIFYGYVDRRGSHCDFAFVTSDTYSDRFGSRAFLPPALARGFSNFEHIAFSIGPVGPSHRLQVLDAWPTAPGNWRPKPLLPKPVPMASESKTTDDAQASTGVSDGSFAAQLTELQEDKKKLIGAISQFQECGTANWLRWTTFAAARGFPKTSALKNLPIHVLDEFTTNNGLRINPTRPTASASPTAPTSSSADAARPGSL